MANRYLVPGGDGNFNSTTNWSTTSGGASGASFPVAADAVIIDANSLNTPLTINVLSNCLSFVCSNYTGTIFVNDTITTTGTLATGNITLSAGMTVTGTGTFAKRGTGTTGVITSNGVVFDCNFEFSNTGSVTTLISGAMRVNGNLTFSLNSTFITTINTGTISLGGNLINNNPISGTATIQFIGSTTATITSVATRFIQVNLVINKTGILNINDLYFGTRTLTYTAGVVNHTGTIYANTGTLNTNGIIWNNFSQTATVSLALSSKLTLADYIGTGSTCSFSGVGGFTVNNFTLPSAASQASLNLTGGVTYTFLNSLTIFGTGSGIQNGGYLRRTSGVGLAKVVLATSAPCKLAYLNIQNIDASGGKGLIVVGLEDGDFNRGASVFNSINCYSIVGKLNQYNKTF